MSDRILVNISAEDLALRREDFVSQILGSIDAKRPTAWTQYGYPERVLFAQLKQAYDRGGAAYGAVHRILGKCWQEKPRIKKKQKQEPGAEPATNATAPKVVPKPADKKKPKQAGKQQTTKGNEEPTPWELKVDALMQSLKGWQKFRDFDRRNMVGRYAALIYRVADSKD